LLQRVDPANISDDPGKHGFLRIRSSPNRLPPVGQGQRCDQKAAFVATICA
jgi:hypothetical protein